LNRGDIAGILDEVPAMAWRVSWGVWPSTPARLHTSLDIVLITLGLSRLSPGTLVAAERNSAKYFLCSVLLGRKGYRNVFLKNT
jgi:hypothetical protein